jgi:hypothetical protein
MTAKSALQGMPDHSSGLIRVNIRKERFEVVANSRKVRLNRFWIDVAALEGDVVAESFRGGVDRKVMEFAKSEVRICCRRVGAGSGVIDCHTKEDGLLMNEALHCPGLLIRLPG